MIGTIELRHARKRKTSGYNLAFSREVYSKAIIKLDRRVRQSCDRYRYRINDEIVKRLEPQSLPRMYVLRVWSVSPCLGRELRPTAAIHDWSKQRKFWCLINNSPTEVKAPF